ncbi:ADP-ribosylglycohydrolase family protein [Devosia sp. A8/3-2]|nr:ADP-ribosylglycohydrolase family protein [Devosia sp. A8/3-2]
MYIAPIGVVHAADPKAAYDEAIAFAAGHQESFGLEAAGVMAAAVAAAFVPGTGIDAIVDAAIAVAKDGTRNAIVEIARIARELRGTGASHAAVCEAFHAAIAKYSPMGDDVTHRPERVGRLTDAYRPSRLNAIEELPLALGFCLLNDGAFRVSIEDGINSGRDTDSIGVMAGAILGALHGESVILAEDRALLDSANRLDLTASADAFTQTAKTILAADHQAAEASARSPYSCLKDFLMLSEIQILEKIYAGFIGKAIGVRLGAPVEPTIWSYERIQKTYGEVTQYLR